MGLSVEIKNDRSQNIACRVRLSPVALALILSLPVYAEEIAANNPNDNALNAVEFESDLLKLDNNNKVDVSRFSYGSSASPGKYRVGIYVNDRQVANDEVEFKEVENGRVAPCLTPKIIQLINFKESQLPASAQQTLAANPACSDLEQLIPDSRVDFDSGEQRLNITVPQIYINRTARGFVSPELWDNGVPTMMLGYYLNGYESRTRGNDEDRSAYASFNSGLNIGAWYLRHNGSYNWDNKNGGKYNVTGTYLQRDITALRGRVIMGEYNTSGQLFNSVPFTGAQLISDERMLPDSRRGYAPEIRGVAKTNAKVTVRQQGNIIYETTVTPGAFLINDLYPTGYGGDLDVTIQEADGSTQQYSIPYASVAQLLRPGTQKYSVTVGRLRDSGVADNPLLYEATLQRGLNNTFTGYGGLQRSENYQAMQAGVAMGTRLGALGTDVTQSWSQLGGKTQGDLRGQSYRVSYSKLINETASNISLAAYRFSSSGYMDFLTAMQTRNAVSEGLDPNSIWRSKNRFTASVNQGLIDGWGSLYLSASMESYWNGDKGYNKQYQLGYSTTVGRVNYGISVARSTSADGQDQTTWYLSFSLPLWENRQSRAPYLNMRYNQDSEGGKGEQATLSGSPGDNNKYSYNLTAAHDNHAGSSGSVSGGWQGSVAMANAGYSKGRNYSSASVGLSGAMVAHSGGITLTPYNSDTYALIEAQGAEGAKISGYGGAEIDSAGYALYPSLSPYQMNHIAIDPAGSPLDVEFESTAENVAPRAGAVVKVKFKTRSGTPVLIASSYAGEPVPFGAEVFNENNEYVGAVTQGGIIYARVAQTKGKLLVKWGEDPAARCQVSYMLTPQPEKKATQPLPQQFNAPCLTPDTADAGTALTANR